MRDWLLTSTTYGTWLPGDARGSVTSVRDQRPGDPDRLVRFEHDTPGEPYEEPIPGLYRHARAALRGPPIYLDAVQAAVVLDQFRETAAFRGWSLAAVAIMANHVHLVVRVPDDPDPTKLLGDFKAYAARALNRRFGEPASGKWWTTNGSKRRLKDEQACAAATHYVLYRQPAALVVWSPDLGRLV